MSENSMSEQMRATLKEVDELKRDLSDDEERCAQTTASAQVVQQQLAEVEQRADANIRQTQQDLQTVRETLLALSGETQAVQTTSGEASTSTSACSGSCACVHDADAAGYPPLRSSAWAKRYSYHPTGSGTEHGYYQQYLQQ